MDFYKSIAPYYHHIFPLNTKQLSFIKSVLPRNDYSVKILDIGCGIGSLTQALDKDYSFINSIDLDQEMVRLAQLNTYSHRPLIQVGNMLKLDTLFPHQLFDCIICFGNTLVHLQNEKSIHEFLKQAYLKLEIGGKLLIQIINYDRIIDHKVDHLPTIENDFIKFVRKYNYLSSDNMISFRTELSIKGTNEAINNEQPLYPIREKEMRKLVLDSGFRHIEFFANFNKDQIHSNSIPLVIEITK